MARIWMLGSLPSSQRLRIARARLASTRPMVPPVSAARAAVSRATSLPLESLA